MIPRWKQAQPSVSWLVDRLRDEGVIDAGQHDRITRALTRDTRRALDRMIRTEEFEAALETPRWRRSARSSWRRLRVRFALWRLNLRAKRRGDTLNDAARRVMAR